MRVQIFNTKPYDRRFFDTANESAGHTLQYTEAKLNAGTAALAAGCDAVCGFVNDSLDRETLDVLARQGVRAVAMRCAGYNNVDLDAARELSIAVVRVPAYSPHAVAEHTVGLILSLNRNIHRAYNRVRDGNFALDGLLGYDLAGRTVGVVGTGKIGATFAAIMKGFGCRLIGYDRYPSDECRRLGLDYVELSELFERADVISLHCPLTPETHHLIDASAIERMKTGVMIVNTSRGAVIDTLAVIAGLKSGKIGHLAIDVYEEEGAYFFEDQSNHAIDDDTLARLMTFPNVLVTGHQAFFTAEALTAIAQTTLRNLTELERTGSCVNAVS